MSEVTAAARTEPGVEHVDSSPGVEHVDLGRGLQTVLRAYLAGAHEAVGDLPGGPRGFQVLSIAIGSECTNQAAMAKELGLDRTVMTYLIDDLEREGLVERRPDPKDRRARQVVTTHTGAAAYREVGQRLAAVEAEVLGVLGDDAEVFRGLLQRLTAGQVAGVDCMNGPGSACAVPESAC